MDTEQPDKPDNELLEHLRARMKELAALKETQGRAVVQAEAIRTTLATTAPREELECLSQAVRDLLDEHAYTDMGPTLDALDERPPTGRTAWRAYAAAALTGLLAKPREGRFSFASRFDVAAADWADRMVARENERNFKD